MIKFLPIIIMSLLTSVFFQNCAPLGDFRATQAQRPIMGTDETFRPYINDFEAYAFASTSNIPIVFANLDKGTAGVCHASYLGASRQINWGYIEINSTIWPTMSEYQKINLIFHELGHCFLNRQHTPVNSVLFCPTSFMDPTVMSTQCIKDNYDAYIKELFSVQNR